VRKTGEQDVQAALAWLKRRGTKANREGMLRYAIRAEKVFGVPVGTLRAYAKTLGRRHDLALGLWATGWYEARMLAAFVDEPARVTPAQMEPQRSRQEVTRRTVRQGADTDRTRGR
jgi:3-methyladenine DNA glycosylase AlkD